MKRLILPAVALALSSSPLLAQDSELEEVSVPEAGVLSLYFENDLFADTDQRYTNGVRLTYTSPDLDKFGSDPTFGSVVGRFDNVRYFAEQEFTRNVIFTLGQSMYTPVDTLSVDLVENDRPYAGWLYTGLGLVWKKEKVRNTLLLNIGVVGDWSYAEESQRLVHEARGIPVPRGWDNQLDNEIGVALAYERMWRLRDKTDGGWDWDALPYLGATVGNVAINARVGTELRFGWNLPDDFGTAAISDSASTSTPVEGLDAKRWQHGLGAHIFARGEGRAVGRDIFLDGNTFSDSHSVEKKNFVGDLTAGISANYKNTKLAYAFVYRTEEFRGQDDGQIFGSLTLTVNF